MSLGYTPLFVGTAGFGAEDPHTILKLKLSHADGALSVGGEPTKTQGRNPGFVHIEAAAAHAYVAMEDEAGTVQAFALDPSDPSRLTPKGQPVSSVGRHPCYIAVDSAGQCLLAANYSSGSVSCLPISEDGSVRAATDSKAHQGSELIDTALHDRQEMAHCHAILPNPVHSKWIAVCDLGLSAVFTYELDTAKGALIGAADDPRHLRLVAGAGCRHCAWSSDGTTLYVNNELDVTVTVANFSPESGALTEVQTINSLPADGSVTGSRAHHRGNSDIHVHPNGRFLYVGIRSSDPGLIGVYSISEDGRALKPVEHVSTQGLVPRNFKIVPAAGGACFLVVGNQETKTVVSFAVDGDTGQLTPAGSISTAPYKACNISFYVPVL